MNLDEAFKTCPMEFKPKCNVVHSSCAWIADCPGLSGMVFKTIEEAKNYENANGIHPQPNTNGRRRRKRRSTPVCILTHLEYSIVCCGYYCPAPKIPSYTSG